MSSPLLARPRRGSARRARFQVESLESRRMLADELGFALSDFSGPMPPAAAEYGQADGSAAPGARVGSSSQRGGATALPTLGGISPVITISRTEGTIPFVVYVDSAATSADGADHPYDQLDYTWDFGDPSSSRVLTNPASGAAVDAATAQAGPEAAFVYDRPGTYTITLTVRGWTGADEVSAATTTTITVAPWAGQTMYFDSVAGRDSNDGLSAEAPKQSWGAISAFLTDANNASGSSGRRALLKAGSTFDYDSVLRLRNNHDGLRIESYGSGARPVVRAAVASEAVFLELDYGRSVTDFVMRGLELDGNNIAPSLVLGYQASNRAATAPYGVAAFDYFVDCKFRRSTRDLVDLPFYGSKAATGSNLGFWGCEFDHGSSPGQALFIDALDHVFVVGGSFRGGDGNRFTDHFIYPTIRSHALFRWIDFGAMVNGNFCINNNIQVIDAATGLPTTADDRDLLVDGCNLSGSQNGMDFSVNNNSTTLGKFDDVIVQNCSFHHLGGAGGQSMGIAGYSVKRITIRDNTFTNIGRLPDGTAFYRSSTDVAFLDPTDGSALPQIYRNTFWKDAGLSSAFLALGAGSGAAGGLVAQNTFATLMDTGNWGRAVLTLNTANLSAWTLSENWYYAPNMVSNGAVSPFLLRDGNSTKRLTLAALQARGWEIGGTMLDPPFSAPAAGSFAQGPGTPPAADLTLAGLATTLSATATDPSFAVVRIRTRVPIAHRQGSGRLPVSLPGRYRVRQVNQVGTIGPASPDLVHAGTPT